MTNNTNKNGNINFANFMSSKGSDDLDNLFGTLSDMGIPVQITGEEFLAENDAYDNVDLLGHNLVFYGKWMIAKVAGFDAIEEIGFSAIKISADHSETIEVMLENGNDAFDGEWCRREGVIYASYAGIIEVASASEAKTQSERDQADMETAKFLLLALFQHADDQRSAA